MQDLTQPLTDEELDFLDRFLLDRIPEDHGMPIDSDEGILCLSELDGFFTALVSGPNMIPPSVWQPAIWGVHEMIWESEDEYMFVFFLMTRYMNSIANSLMRRPNEFIALFNESVFENESRIIVDEWCEGYMRAIYLDYEAWQTQTLEMKILLTPIRSFTSTTDWQAHRHNMDQNEIANLRKAIEPNVGQIYTYWMSRRAHQQKPQPFSRNTEKTGRNKPCSCGSGKKFKYCCLH